MVIRKPVRAIICNQMGDASLLEIGEINSPVLASDEVRVRVRRAGVNFPDTLMIKGQYQLKPPLPFAPGFEIAGEIIEVGEDAGEWRPGDRVMGLTSSGYGAFAEEATIRRQAVVSVPDGFDLSKAMALLTPYGTSYHALVQRGGLQPGEQLVVLGASGSVGLAAIEIGKALGARVIAVGRSEERLKLAAAKGADVLLSYEDPAFKQNILSATNGKGADVCLDTLGGKAFDTMSRAMNWNGRLLVVGFTSGTIPTLSTNLVLLKGYQLVGVWWSEFINRMPAANQANFEALFQLYADGKIDPHIAGSFPLSGVPEALDQLLDRTTAGKLIINLDDSCG